MITFLEPLVGGILIGISASIMLGGLGRITGISGIFSSLLTMPRKIEAWRLNFILGLIGGGIAMYLLYPRFFAFSLDFPLWRIVLAGLLVGIGTRIGSGCTSGHGVCGLPRMSKRSIVATIVFMSFGVLTVAVERLFFHA